MIIDSYIFRKKRVSWMYKKEKKSEQKRKERNH